MKETNIIKGDVCLNVLREVSKYMDVDVFIKENKQLIKRASDTNEPPLTSRELRNKINEYKLKRNGKKDFTEDKAIIDILDSGASIAQKIEDGYRATPLIISKDKVTRSLCYEEDICLPFNDCFIYMYVENGQMGIGYDIKYDKGAYKCIMYICVDKQMIIQCYFDMTPEVDEGHRYWNIDFTLNKYQKPLGICTSNFTSLICCYTSSIMAKGKCVLENDLTDTISLILILLKYLNSYKSKVIYKASKDNSNVYIYSNKTKNELDEYMNTNYPGYTYERQKGWIVKGYYKIIDGIGIDENGKPVKNLNWTIPYKDETKEDVTSSKQSSSVIVNHALKRIKQRYNMEMSEEDLENIVDECVKGHCTKLNVKDRFGKIKNRKGLKGCYRINYKNTYIDFVLCQMNDGTERIATFLPKPENPNYNIIDSATYARIKEDIDA